MDIYLSLNSRYFQKFPIQKPSWAMVALNLLVKNIASIFWPTNQLIIGYNIFEFSQNFEKTRVLLATMFLRFLNVKRLCK